MHVPEFDEGVALIVGGSGGIGSEIARALAEAGSDIAVTYRGNVTAAEDVAAEVRVLGRKASVHRMDLGDDVLTINGDFRAPRRAQSHMKNRPIFGEIDFFALKHRIDPAFQTRLFGELKKQGEGLIGDPIL